MVNWTSWINHSPNKKKPTALVDFFYIPFSNWELGELVSLSIWNELHKSNSLRDNKISGITREVRRAIPEITLSSGSWTLLFHSLIETSYTSQTQPYSYISQITRKIGVQFVKLGYLSESNRLVPLSDLFPIYSWKYPSSQNFTHEHKQWPCG